MLRALQHDRDSYSVAFVFAVLGFAAFSLMDAVSKTLSSSHSLPQVLFFSGIFAVIFSLLLSKPLGGFKIHSAKGWAVVSARGVMSAGMIWLTLYAISRMPIADVYSIRFTSPIITILLALVFLRERPNNFQWLSAVLGLAGVMIVLQPSGATDNVAVLCRGRCFACNRKAMPDAFDTDGAVLFHGAFSVYPTALEFIIRLPILLRTAEPGVMGGLFSCSREWCCRCAGEPEGVVRAIMSACFPRSFLKAITIDNRCLPCSRFSVRL